VGRNQGRERKLGKRGWQGKLTRMKGKKKKEEDLGETVD